jgi:hypothetical protein
MIPLNEEVVSGIKIKDEQYSMTGPIRFTTVVPGVAGQAIIQHKKDTD